jgi:glutamine synthetase
MKFSATLLVLFAGSSAAFAPTFAVPKARLQSSLAAGVLEGETGRSQLDPAVVDRYNALPFPADLVLAEYVWVDADGETRSKTRTLPPSKVSLCYMLISVDRGH